MMRRTRADLLPLLALVTGVLLPACSEDDRNPVGAVQLPPLSDSIQELTLEPILIATFPTGSDERGLGDVLIAAHLLPDSAGFESRILLRFGFTLADTISSPVVIDSARVRLLVGVSPESVAFRVHRVTESWNEAEVSWDERAFGLPWSLPGGAFDPTPLGGGTLAGDSATFALPESLTQRWLDEPESNQGIILLIDTPGAFARARAGSTAGVTTEDAPRLLLFVTVSDSSSVSDVTATADAYITTYGGQVAAGLAVGNEPFFRSLLKFDVSAIPARASINLAELRLAPRQVVSPVDTLLIELRRAVSAFLGGATVFSSTTDPLDREPVRADSIVTFSGPTLAGLVRVWQLDPTLNLGLGLQVVPQSGNLGFAVYDSSASAPADLPRLRIIFTPPLEPDLGRRGR